MTTFFVGLLEEVMPISRTNKEGVVNNSAQVTVTFESRNADGYLIKSTEDIQLGMNYFDELQSSKGKYISVPYTTISTKNGTYTFPDDKMKFIIFGSNPLNNSVGREKKAS